MWTYASYAGSRLLVFLSTVILARLLVPTEFGQVAFALLVISYLDAVGDLGISSALIYEKDDVRTASNIAFVTSLAAGVTWFLLVFLAAPYIAQFFQDPGITPILRTMAWVFPINALGNVHDALLRKELRFGRRLIPDIASAIVKGTISIILAWKGWGAWSLVWGQIGGAIITTVVLWIAIPWRPSFSGSLVVARRMLGYGGKIVSVNIISAIVHDADFVVVGRMLGATALGFYTMAYRIPEMAITMVIWVIGKVAFPVYSKLRDDVPGLRAAFLVTLRYLSILTVPAGVGLAILASLFIEVFFGERWSEAASAMQALAIAGCIRSLGSHAGDVYKATGRPDILVKLGIARAIVLVPAMIWAAGYGILGVAIAQIVVTSLSTVANLVIAGRVLSLSVFELIAEFRDAIAASALMSIVLYILLAASDGTVGNALRLASLVLAGIVVYATYFVIFSRDTLIQAYTLVWPLRRREAK
jgi:PST family polysaccharide transporter